MAAKKKKKITSKKKAIKRKALKKRAVSKRTARKKLPRRPLKKRISQKAPRRKPAAKAKKPGIKKPKGKAIGLVTHYFPKVRAAVIKLKAPLTTGDAVKIKGHTTDFQQVVSSMQIDRVPIDQAKKGQEIGLLVNSRVRQHDLVYKA